MFITALLKRFLEDTNKKVAEQILGKLHIPEYVGLSDLWKKIYLLLYYY